jgi:tetratricopeptide (TPR) repeat protein
MKNLYLVYLNPLDFGKPLSLKALFPGEAPVVWMEDPRFLLHAASWLEGAWAIRPWRSRHWGDDPAETAMRREWIRLDLGDHPRLILATGPDSLARATAFLERHQVPHARHQAIPGTDGWSLGPLPEAPAGALAFPLELRGLSDPGALAAILRQLPWPAALCGLHQGDHRTWLHASRDGDPVLVPARAAGMMSDVPEELYGWYTDASTGPVLQALVSVQADPGDLWACEKALADGVRDWARGRRDLTGPSLDSLPKPKALQRLFEELLHGGEVVAGLTLARTAATLEPTASRIEELARWYNRVDDYGHATDLVEVALGLEPDNRSLLANRVRLRIAYGDWERAAADLEEARRAGDDLALDLLGFRLAEGRGDTAGALPAGRALTERLKGKEGRRHDRRERVEFHLAFAGICLSAGEYAEGLDAVYSAVSLEREHPGAYYLAALMLAGALQWNDALGELKKAAHFGNDASWVSFVELLACVSEGRIDQAVAAGVECERRIDHELEHLGEDFPPTLETRLLLAAFHQERDLFEKTARALDGCEPSGELRFLARLLLETTPGLERYPWPEHVLHG